MDFLPTPIKDLFVIVPKVFEDSRGYFFEAFRQDYFSEKGIKNPFIQENQSRSSKGVLRGLHYQAEPYAQSKLVRVVKGEILDVAVDLRKDSSTFGQHFCIILSEENKKQLYIPKGFAHGFLTLSEIADVFYKCDEIYNKDSERGVRYNDPKLNIDWNSYGTNFTVSDKDANWPFLN